jgi:ATP-dependent protease ClpP protease subunit
MASWFELQKEFVTKPPNERGPWLAAQISEKIDELATMTGRNVVFYASGFLQKPQTPSFFHSVSLEDVNGFMTCLMGMNFKKGLFLLLHTPGGQAEAAETIVDYLWSKFDSIETAIPTYAMSAGTMISLASNRLVMGRQSQLGPTDPQIIIGNRSFSAHSIEQQFEEAKQEISKNPATANAWYPVLQPFGPALLQEARKAMAYGNSLVEKWLAARMFAGKPEAAALAKSTAEFFGGKDHGSHGRRINRQEVAAHGIEVQSLEDDGNLQSAVLTLYHLVTLAFESGPAVKVIMSSNGASFIKNFGAT